MHHVKAQRFLAKWSSVLGSTPAQTQKENWSNQDASTVVADANVTHIVSAPRGSLH